MQFEPVDLSENLALCVAFRRDIHLSDGSDRHFDAKQRIEWFRTLKQGNLSDFEHIILNCKIIGQLEYHVRMKGGIPLGYLT